MGNLFDIRVIPHKMYFNSGFFPMCLLFSFFYFLFFLFSRLLFSPGGNIKKGDVSVRVILRAKTNFFSPNAQLGLFPFRCVRDNVLFFQFILLLSRATECYEFTHSQRAFFSVICSNIYPPTYR